MADIDATRLGAVLPRIGIPLVQGRPLLLCGLLCAFVLTGLFGRDPWKPDEAYTVGVVHHIVQTGEWVVPRLAGEPFMEKPPLFYVTAAAFANAFSGALDEHDAARLATALYVGLTLLFTSLGAATLYGRDRALACAIVLIGCLGYVVPAHLLFTDHAMLAGLAMALYGLADFLKRPTRAGIFVGTGAGIAFMAKGLLGPGLVALTALALALLPAWRSRSYSRSLGIALVAFSPWALVWPALLYRESPALFNEWFVVNNVGRFAGWARVGPSEDHFMYFKVLPWFAMPALPLAAWHLWTGRLERPWLRPEIQVPLVSVGSMLVVLSAACTAREVYALPFLIPLALLAVARPLTLSAQTSAWLRSLATFIGGVLALALWLAWFALIVHWPAPIADRLVATAPGFEPALQLGTAVLACVATTGWIALVRATSSSPDGLPIAWAATVTLPWLLMMTIWLPYLDYRNSYRTVVAQIKSRLPTHFRCLANRQLGEPQRAMLDYFGGLLTQRDSAAAGAQCPLLLVQSLHTPEELASPRPWTLLWSGARPGDNNEHFWLLQAQSRMYPSTEISRPARSPKGQPYKESARILAPPGAVRKSQ